MAKVISNKRQLNRLVELMEENLDVAKGYCTKTAAQAKWEKFSRELNILGPPAREWQKWQRVWIDLKCKTKKKRVENKVEISETGGGPNRCHLFNDSEEAMIRILELNTSCVDPPSPSQGSLPNDGKTTAPRRTRVTSRVEELQQYDSKLLEDQTSAQKHFYDNMINIMSDLKRSMENVECYSKQKYQQDQEHNIEILKLKKEKLKLYKENKETKDNHRKAKLKLKMEALALTKQMQHLKNL